MAQPFATVNEMTELFRAMTADEQARAAKLLPIVSDTLRVEARNAGKDLDRMIAADCSGSYANVVKSVTVDVTARALMTPTNEAPMSQFAQSALGYSVSGTFLVPGGGLFVKREELRRLGLRVQKGGCIRLD